VADADFGVNDRLKGAILPREITGGDRRIIVQARQHDEASRVEPESSWGSEALHAPRIGTGWPCGLRSSQIAATNSVKLTYPHGEPGAAATTIGWLPGHAHYSVARICWRGIR